MSRILLVDDSPHAQRMGERILSEEGYEVVTVSNADSALIRMDDVDPDVVLADTVMPGRTGFEICQFLKMSPRHKHVRVILTAGVLEPLDEAEIRRVEADGTLKKPFEATALVSAVKPLADAAVRDRASAAGPPAAAAPAAVLKGPAAPFIAVIDAEQVRAAVTVALDAVMENMVEQITARVVAALGSKKPAEPVAAATAPEPARPPDAAPASTPLEPVRRVNPVRLRSSPFLGLGLSRPGPEDMPAESDSE
jgi:CheY-like chemotaxis protein